jgi:hypothetical protein
MCSEARCMCALDPFPIVIHETILHRKFGQATCALYLASFQAFARQGFADLLSHGVGLGQVDQVPGLPFG